jgi:hypothetical protein
MDIAKCQNEDCPQKEQCERYTCKAGEYQSYADFKPENGECEFLIKTYK